MQNIEEKIRNTFLLGLLLSFCWYTILSNIVFGILLSVLVASKIITEGNLLLINIVLAYILGYIIIRHLIIQRVKKNLAFPANGLNTRQLTNKIFLKWSCVITLFLFVISSIIVAVSEIYNIEQLPYLGWVGIILQPSAFFWVCSKDKNKNFIINTGQ